jgi:hypothetical protein
MSPFMSGQRCEIALKGHDLIAQGKRKRVLRAWAPPWVYNKPGLFLAPKERDISDASFIALFQSCLSFVLADPGLRPGLS